MFNQVRYLPDSRIEAHVVCNSTENIRQFGVANLHELGGPRYWRYWCEKVPKKLGFPSYSRFLVRTAQKVGAELVHSHFGSGGWDDLPSVQRTKARHVVTFYGYDVSGLPTENLVWRERYKEVFHAADMILCEGPFMAAAVIDLGCPPEKMRVHHLGVETGSIDFMPRSWTPGTPLRVLIAASFREKKGIPDALLALSKIKDEVPLEVTIVGDAGPDPNQQREKRRILDIIEQNNLGQIVTMLGYQPFSRLSKEAYRNHVYLSPSLTASNGDTEGGAPVAMIEMMASGMPVVSTRHCDIPNVVNSGETGLLAAERDIEGLANHLRWLIANPDYWKGMVVRARQKIEKEFDAHTQGQELAELYEELVHKKPREVER
jgi:colanic acid/amylovoran biosynthesis glycosyltransferase